MATSNDGAMSEPGNDIILLERVFLRLGNADTDEQLEGCVSKFLPPVLLKLASPHEQVRTKVMELLVHINKRVKCRPNVQLPLPALLSMYQDEKATSFVINFTIIYITMGFPRLPKERQVELMPDLFGSIASRPQSHQDDILLLVMPMLGDLGNKTPSLDLKNRPQQAKIVLRLALDLLLLPYGALPGSKEAGSEFPVPPGLSPQAYKKLTEKSNIDASQLELTKQSIVKFLNNDAVSDNDTLLPLIVAAADSRFSVANVATTALGRVASSVDWSNASVVSPLYSLFLGGQQQRVPACTRIRLKLLHYLNKATGAAILIPHSIQVIFTSLFAQNTNPRLKTLALNFSMNIIQNGDVEQLKKVSPVVLGGLLKVTNMEEEWSHHSQAFTCAGRLVARCPNAMSKPYELLEELFNKMPGASPELRLAIREALLAMAASFTIDPSLDSKKVQPMEVDTPGESSMEVDEQKSDKKDESKDDKEHRTHIATLLEKHMDSEDAMVRFVAARYASVLFSEDSVASKYLLLLASGDNKDEVKLEALKALYGTARQSEIEDMVQNTEPSGVTRKGSPTFVAMVQHIWGNVLKRKEGSNQKHRFVTGNHVLPFQPSAYYEMLRYLRMCLNRDAGIKDGVPHPSTSSPVLGKHLNKISSESPEALNNYLAMVKILLSACPDIVPLTCLLDIVGCIPKKMSTQYVEQLGFFSSQFANSSREEIRDASALLYAIVKAHTSDKKTIGADILEMISKSKTVKSLESQCGYMSAYSALLERAITLKKYKMSATLNSENFDIITWQPYVDGVTLLGEFLSNSQSLLVSYACQNIALLGKRHALPIPEKLEKETPEITDDGGKDPSKLSKQNVVEKLFSILKSSKYSSKIKERATITLGNLCVGEQYPYAKDIIQGFLDMAKETKDIEIHMEIGESLVLCVTGVNSEQNRDLWSQPPPMNSASNVPDNKALADNDILLEWLLQELFKFVTIPHPNSRQACCVWLLALVKNCSERNPIKSKWATIQETFMEFLSENSDIVQDIASKGLSLVYQGCGEEEKREMMNKLVEQLAGGTRKVQQVTQDTKLFEDGQLGKSPLGGSLSTYKELCSLASDLNQPDLIYKFMHLANHNSIWNSKKGAAFGFQYIMQQAGDQLSEHLPKIVPRLYRYRFDPTPKIQNSMSSIWHALVPETQKTVEKYIKEILDDLVNNLTSNQWRVRTSCCQGLSDLIRTSKSMWDFIPRLEEIWTQLFRVMDDVHEGTRTAATNTTSLLAKICITATDSQHPGTLGKEILTVILPVLMNQGITNTVAEVRNISLQTVSKLVSSNGNSLKPFMAQLVPGLLRAAGELESSKLSYMSAALGAQQQSQEAVDSVRAFAAKTHYSTETVTKCIQYIDADCLATMLPQVLEILRAPQLGTKVAVGHCLALLGLQLGKDLQPMAGKIILALVNTLLDRNPTVRKQCADTIGIIVGSAKESSVDKLMQKLCTWYKEKDDDSVRSAIALTFYACSNRHAELLKERSTVVMPTLFVAMHAEKTPDTKATVELYEEIWSDISPSKELGIKNNLHDICTCLKEGISSPSWTTKAQAARGIETVANEVKSGLGNERIELLNILLEGLKGRSWQGKETLVNSIAQLCRTCDEGETLPDPLVESILESVMRECSKQEPLYKIKCLAALGDILNELKIDRFQQVYTILHDTLAKNVGSVENDSDDENNSSELLKKKEQLISLKEVAYETLGKAWPDNTETQGKYQRVFTEHCSEHMSISTRTVQVAILMALGYYVEKLVLLNKPSSTSNCEDLSFILDNLIKVLDYSFNILKHTRLRKEALNILSTVGKKLKENKNSVAFDKLKQLYVKYENDLNTDSAPEVRTRMVQIKAMFQTSTVV